MHSNRWISLRNESVLTKFGMVLPRAFWLFDFPIFGYFVQFCDFSVFRFFNFSSIEKNWTIETEMSENWIIFQFFNISVLRFFSISTFQFFSTFYILDFQFFVFKTLDFSIFRFILQFLNFQLFDILAFQFLKF